MPKATLTAIKYALPQGVTTHTWSDKTRSTLGGCFDRIDPADGYPWECYSITAHCDHATDDVVTVVMNSCNHLYADSAFKAQRDAITAELRARVALLAGHKIGPVARHVMNVITDNERFMPSSSIVMELELHFRHVLIDVYGVDPAKHRTLNAGQLQEWTRLARNAAWNAGKYDAAVFCWPSRTGVQGAYPRTGA